MARKFAEASPATKRIVKLENALCEVIRRANERPSRALLDEIQQIAMRGAGLVQGD